MLFLAGRAVDSVVLRLQKPFEATEADLVIAREHDALSVA